MDDVESIQRRQAREAIESGRMPRKHPDWVCSGPGVGALCSVCGVPNQKAETEFEVQFTGNTPPIPELHHVHPRCHAMWELMRRMPKQ